ncbi:MAG: VWA domain-containing protein [Gemmataceae bacterium]|nr:VWA domain-containing protein [Gemmataceae bacterium]
MLSSPVSGGYHPRVPVVILLDKSPSEAAHEEELYVGMDAGATVMKEDPVTAGTALVGQMEFNSEVRAGPVVPAADFAPARLLPVGGTTLLGKALDAAMDALDRITADLRRQGIPARRRLLVVLTDARTRDAIDGPIARVHEAERDGLWVLPVGVGDIDRATLDRISSRGPGKVAADRNYRELMLWIAQIVNDLSRNRPVSDANFPPAGPVSRN